MKRPLRRLFLALLAVAAGLFLNERAAGRAKARDRELSERLAGPLLPGVPNIGKSSWSIAVEGEEAEFRIDGIPRDELGADLVRETLPPAPAPFKDKAYSFWFVGVGTPTEARFLETLRSDSDAQDAWENPVRSIPHGAILKVNGTAASILPNDNRETKRAFMKSDGAGLRNRLVAALEAESVRGGVAFAEERLTVGLFIGVNNWPAEGEPGRFRRAVGWCCRQFDFLPLDSLADWASRKGTIPSDPVFPLNDHNLALGIREGMSAPYRKLHNRGDWFEHLSLNVEASTPLADSLRELVAKHRPETLGCRFDPHDPEVPRAAVNVGFSDRTEARIVPLSDARFRAFLLDILRLLADPPPIAPPRLKEETHAESAESVEPDPHAEPAEGAE